MCSVAVPSAQHMKRCLVRQQGNGPWIPSRLGGCQPAYNTESLSVGHNGRRVGECHAQDMLDVSHVL